MSPTTVDRRVPTLMFTSLDIRRWVGDPLLGWQPYLLGPVETIGYPGTHLELLETSPTYQEIVNSQLAAEEAA